MVLENLGERIRQERQKARLTQEQLAEMAGCNESYIGQIERGQKNPSLEVLVNIANSLNVTLDYLLADNMEIDEIDGLMNEINALLKDRDPEDIRFIITINRLFLDLLGCLPPTLTSAKPQKFTPLTDGQIECKSTTIA